MDYKLLFLVLFSVIGRSVCQLRCYACSFSSVDTDRSCLEISNSTPSVDCSYRYCTILRQEFIDPAGQVASFLRGCEDSPDFLNHEISDPDFRTFYRACTNDFCNIGNGIQSVVGGHLSPYPEYTGENLLVPGSGAPTVFIINIYLITLLLIMLL